MIISNSLLKYMNYSFRAFSISLFLFYFFNSFQSNIYEVLFIDERMLIDDIYNVWLAEDLYNRFSSVTNANLKKILSVIIELAYGDIANKRTSFNSLKISKNQIGLIDNQDALIGNKAYDLASLIDDVRYKTPNSLKDKVYNYYLSTNKKIDVNKFKNDFDILSVLRNLKIIGIFMRLAERDKKRKYLKLIPYAWNMIDSRMSKNNDLINLKLLLATNFPKFITK